VYDGGDMMPLIAAAYERRRDDPAAPERDVRWLELATTMGSIPASYFLYYYYKEQELAAMRAKPTTRAQDILAAVPDYWQHYREQAAADEPALDPNRSRGGLHELELAIDVMDAVFNDRREIWPVNVPNRGAIPDFPDDLVVEVPGYVDRHGVVPLTAGPLPPQVVGLVKMLGEYQALAAEAAWSGGRREAIRALASNPLCFSLRAATAIYDEMAAAHREHLPDRLVQGGSHA
jgi:6-phospho-beta-glucosidase